MLRLEQKYLKNGYEIKTSEILKDSPLNNKS